MSGKKKEGKAALSAAEKSKKILKRSVAEKGYLKETASSSQGKVDTKTKILPRGFQVIPEENLKFEHYGKLNIRSAELSVEGFIYSKPIPEQIDIKKLKFTYEGGGKADGHLNEGTCTIEHTVLDGAEMHFKNYAHEFCELEYELIMKQQIEKTKEWEEVFAYKLIRNGHSIPIPSGPALFKGFSRVINLDKNLITPKNPLTNTNNVNFILGIKREPVIMDDYKEKYEGSRQWNRCIFCKPDDKEATKCLLNDIIVTERCKYLHPYLRDVHEVYKNGEKCLSHEASIFFDIKKYMLKGKFILEYSTDGKIMHDKDYVKLFSIAHELELKGLCQKIENYLFFCNDVSVIFYLEPLSKQYPEVFSPEALDDFKLKYCEEISSNAVYHELLLAKEKVEKEKAEKEKIKKEEAEKKKAEKKHRK